jgi:hypothetical protein
MRCCRCKAKAVNQSFTISSCAPYRQNMQIIVFCRLQTLQWPSRESVYCGNVRTRGITRSSIRRRMRSSRSTTIANHPMGQRRGGSCPGLWTLRVAWAETRHPAQPDNPLFPALAESSVDQKSDAAISVVGRYKNGKFGHFDISLGHWRADQRDFVTTIWRDVTERVAADAALRDARDALQRT